MFSRNDLHYEIQASQLWLLFCAECTWRALFGEGARPSNASRPALQGRATR